MSPMNIRRWLGYGTAPRHRTWLFSPAYPESPCSHTPHVGSGTVRTDDDSWEITESVGATALGVAAARAAESESSDPLINDPFARVFLDRVGPGAWDWYGAPDLPAEVIEAEP